MKDIEDPEYGKLRASGLPFHMTGFGNSSPTRAPKLGEHTREILAALDYDEARIEALIQSEVVKAE